MTGRSTAYDDPADGMQHQVARDVLAVLVAVHRRDRMAGGGDGAGALAVGDDAGAGDVPDVTSAMRDLLGYFSAIEHMGTFSRGIIDTRPIVLYVSMTVVVLVLTYQAFQFRKWRL